MSEPLTESQHSTSDQVSGMFMGAMLKAERERRELSIEDVSKNLCISLRQVIALESDQFAILPEPMITRGFIRNYARLLEIDAEPLLHAYRSQTPVNELHSINLPSANIVITSREQRPWMRFGLLSLFVLLLAAIWFVYMDFKAKSASPKLAASTQNVEVAANHEATPETLPIPLPAAPATEESSSNAAVSASAEPVTIKSDAGSATKNMEAVLDQSASVSSGAVAAVAGNVNQPVPVVVNSAAQLRFVATEKSWISVLDRDNKQIFNKTKPANSEDTVKGQPPFRLTLGNVRATRVFLNDKPVDLEPYRKGNVARLTLQ
jgi:cytoskeleton protein RodZ